MKVFFRSVSPMEKYQLLFPQDDEHGVPQLWHLGQGEEPSPEAAHFVLLHEARVADGVVEAAGGEGVQELGEDSRKAADAEDGEERAPGSERSSELVGRPGGHPGLPGEDEDDVDGAGPRCHRHPVLLHPPLRLPLVEALLEVEDVRVDRVVADQRLQRLQGGKLGPHCFLLQQVHLHPEWEFVHCIDFLQIGSTLWQSFYLVSLLTLALAINQGNLSSSQLQNFIKQSEQFNKMILFT